jgi:hypothetical protein
LARILKKGGYFITRNPVYLPDRSMNIDQLQKSYDQRKIHWMILLLALCYFVWRPECYDRQKQLYNWKNYFVRFNQAVKNREIRLSQLDLDRMANIEKHGTGVLHYVPMRKQWQQMVRKYFIIEAAATVKKWPQADFIPIYVLRKK